MSNLLGRIAQGQQVSVGQWGKALAEREAFAQRFDALIAQQPSPRYVAAALVRKASMADSMWQGITTLEKRGFSLFTPAQLKTLSSMCPTPTSSLCDLAADIREKVAHGFADKRAQETAAAVAFAISGYAWAIAFGKEFSVTDPALERARARLSVFRNALGDRFWHFVEIATPPSALAQESERVTRASLGVIQ